MRSDDVSLVCEKSRKRKRRRREKEKKGGSMFHRTMMYECVYEQLYDMICINHTNNSLL